MIQPTYGIANGIGSYSNIETLRGRKDPEAVKIVAREMESLFAYELLKAMRQDQESTEGLGKGLYQSLFDMELARLMADRGLGLKEILLKGLERKEGLDLSYPMKGIDKTESHENKSDLGEINPDSKEALNPLPKKEDRERDLSVNGSGSQKDLRILGGEGMISSYFGMRRHPIYGDKRFHHGIDIAASEGTAIYPIRPGRVIFSGEMGGYGNVVIIEHSDGYTTKYAHNRVNLVKTGDYVDTNTVIAQVGSTGISTGPHLHFEIRYRGEAMDPLTILAMKD